MKLEKDKLQEKELSAMTEKELLWQLVSLQKKNGKRLLILEVTMLILAMATGVVLIFVIPETMRSLDIAEETIVQAGTLIETAQETVELASREIHDISDTMDKISVAADSAGGLIGDADTALENISVTVSQAQESITEAQSVLQNVDKLVEDNAELVHESIRKMSEIDFEGLNESIDSLRAIVEPLAGLFGRGR